ncbi:transposase [Rhizobium sp. CFBP 8762]|uniref:transposase n=1 Tax=Rhizobium sp. CFBP 8762 TaxID=2775279 RepID=UPI00177FF5B0|nr:transposase [Rhizobium sp. CFBP 8762]MBD8556990.1 transposase [Rhizobium sp. CFBP 8762]
MADREFMGGGWVEFLRKNNVAFAIRVKINQRVALADGRLWALRTLLRKRRRSRSITTLEACLPASSVPVLFAAKWITGRKACQGEWLVVMTNTADAKSALRAYKGRWAIECLFGDTKTRGFNIEDTRMTASEKIDTLTAILTLAITWSYRCATKCHQCMETNMS